MATRSKLITLVNQLHRHWGDPVLPPTSDPFGLVLWQQVAYLVDDTRRAEAFAMLQEKVGAGGGKILLLTRTHPVLALDSNGLRVLLRVGYGVEEKSYPRTYRSVQEAVAPELPTDFAWLIRAHGLLRHHGAADCRRKTPACEPCCVRRRCSFAAAAGS